MIYNFGIAFIFLAIGLLTVHTMDVIRPNRQVEGQSLVKLSREAILEEKDLEMLRSRTVFYFELAQDLRKAKTEEIEQGFYDLRLVTFVVAGIFTLGLAVGLTISDLTEGTTVANLGYEKVTHPNPVFHGDTLYVETEVLDKRPSNSRPDCGVIRLKHSGFKSDSIIVIKFERIVLFLKRPSSAN